MANEIKKIPFHILEMLQKQTNEDHRLEQKEIVARLERDHGIVCNRKTVAENIRLLKDLDHDIVYDNGYYLVSREFDNEEIRYLYDSVLFSKNLTQSQAKRLLDKIKNLGDEYFQQEIPTVKMLPTGIGHSESTSFMLTVSNLHQAIAKKKKVELSYVKYGTDLKQHSNGKRYVVNPYYLVAANGHYFLMCNYDKYDDMAHLRVDRIRDVDILDEKIKPSKLVKDYTEMRDLPKHMAEHVYMFNGKSSRIKLKTTEDMMSDLIDWFGKDIKIVKQEGKDIEVVLYCNEMAMKYWALQYGLFVEVLEPLELRREMQKATKTLYKKYN